MLPPTSPQSKPLLERLQAINQQFYANFAEQFAQTRHLLNPGIERAFATLAAEQAANFIDVGCGDGRVGRHWLRLSQAQPCSYLGLDGSAALLAAGAAHFPPSTATAKWQLRQSDLSTQHWSVGLPQFALIGCFAMLHHLPRPLQLPFLQQLRRVATPNAAAIISVWQFAHLQRFLNKRVDWATVGIANAELTEQDYLLDWRQGGIGLRYVYHFKDAELVALCEQAGWQVLSQFRSDGASHDLGLYTLLRAD